MYVQSVYFVYYPVDQSNDQYLKNLQLIKILKDNVKIISL